MNRKLALMLTLVLAFTFTLAGCSKKANSIHGEWYAADAFNKEIKMTISKNSIDIKTDKKNKKMTFPDSQIGVVSGVQYYSFVINKQNYSLVFPDIHDQNTALFIKTTSPDDHFNGALVYTMNRKETPDYETYGQRYFSD